MEGFNGALESGGASRIGSGTCFRTNDEMGGDSTGATYFPTNNEGRGADYEEYPPADHHAVERQGIGQRSGACLWVCWARSHSALELPGHLPEG